MECPLWAEMIPDRERLEQMAFPRIFAMAQKAWNPDITYEEFLEQTEKELLALEEDRICHFSLAEADISGRAQLDAVAAAWKPMIDGVLAMGDAAKAYLPIFRRLISTKLEDQFSGEELHGFLQEMNLE